MSSIVPVRRLVGKVAVVTASTDGIGFAIARRLAREGAKVVISSRTQTNVDNAVKKLQQEGLNIRGIVCHVGKAHDRQKLFQVSDELGGLDILVSNAAANREPCNVLDSSESEWDKIFEINVKASFLLAKEALPQIRKSKSGRIVFISSIVGYDPMEQLGVHSVSKTTLLGLTKAAAIQLARENITVNCIAPGIINTKFTKAVLTDNEMSLRKIPMGRFGTPDEVSGVVAFLASDDGVYVTGETIVVSGGMTSRL